MGGSASAPKQSDQSKEAERLQIELMQQQLEDAKNPKDIKIPKVKPPLPTPPPPMQSSSDVAQAEEAARRTAMRRTNTARGTLFAGETGGYGGSSKTLLG